MSEGGEKCFDLLSLPALFQHIVGQCSSAQEQRDKQGAAFPKKHLLLPHEKIDSIVLELHEIFDLLQAEDDPPAAKGYGKEEPNRGEHEPELTCAIESSRRSNEARRERG